LQQAKSANTLTLFGLRIAHPIDVDRSAGLVLTNRREATTNVGIEALGTFRSEPYAVTATYTSTVRDRRAARRAATRAAADFCERREPYRRAADAVGSIGSPQPRRRRSLDR
jgi:hypothetical protein